MKNKLFRIAITLLIIMLITGMAFSESNKQATNASIPEMSTQNRVFSQQVLDALKNDDVNTLDKLAQNVQATYWRQTLEICQALISSNNNLRLRLQLVHKYGLEALNQAAQMPIETEIELLQCLLTDQEVVDTAEDWISLRHQKSILYLAAWQRLDKMIDRKFDFNYVPSSTVMPPIGVKIDPGASPEAITDPKLRKEYEVLIEANNKKIEYYNQQHSLNMIDIVYPSQAEKYLIAAFAIPPYNIEDLRALMNHYLKDPHIRDRILKAVTERVANKLK